MKLSVIIVNYNVKYFLEQCLHSVLQAIDAIAAEVLVIDNDSSDGSVEYLRPLFPSVKFIGSKENLGFGKANNLGLKEAAGEYVLFLNPDTIVPEDCFTKCISFLDTNKQAGAIGVRMLDGSGGFLPESKRSFPTTSTAFYKAIGLSALFPNSTTFNKYALGYLDDKKDHPVDVLAGAFMMVRKNLLDKTGGFDEQFFMYGEDIDLSYRLKQTGYNNWYFSGTSIIHFKGESLKKWSSNHVKVFYEAMMVFVRKHYTGTGSFFLRLVLFSGIKTRALVSLLGSNSPEKSSLQKHIELQKAVIVGSKKEYDDCCSILKAARKENMAAGWFALSEDGSDQPDRLKQFCIEKQATMIVFCIGTVSYRHIIGLMQTIGPGYLYRFYAAGSNSIVGSDSKSDLGEVIALQ
jgi:N-acetylglucosaminyl-diphospho-decaprenol L-rhamnosyltransferase